MNPLSVLKNSTPTQWVLASAVLFFTGLAVALVMDSDDAAHSEPEKLSMNYAADQPYYQQVAVEDLSLQQNYAIERLYSGSVKAKQHAQISFELNGKVAQVYVDVGDRVKKGQKLALLDTTHLKIEERQLKAKISETKAQMELLQANLKRHHALKGEGFSSQQKLDELLAEEKTLIAIKQQLLANLDLIHFNLRRTTLKAPFNGSITARYVDSGHVINAGQSVVRVQQQGQMEVSIGVPVQLAYKLQQGTEYLVNIAGNQYLATLLSISTDVQPTTHAVLLRLKLPETASVFNGDLAELALNESILQAGYWVPAAAVTDGVRGLWSVYVVKASGTTTIPAVLEKRDVAIHHAQSTRYFVSGALQPGEQIVANGLHKLVPGQKVRLQQLIQNTDSYQL